MIISAEKLKEIPELSAVNSCELTKQCTALEYAIHRATHNHFTIPQTGYVTSIINGKLQMVRPPIKVGDTVLISKSAYNNDEICSITKVDGSINRELIDDSSVRVTLIKYPPDLIEGAIGMLKYNNSKNTKVGVSSESLSRHSVTYDRNFDNILSYPTDVVGFLYKFLKARF